MNRYLISQRTPLAALFLGFVLGGCYSSPVPLEEDPSRPVDSEWIGAWVDADNPAHRMTVREGESGWYEIDAVDEEKNKRYAIRAFATELEGEVIVSFQERGEAEWNFARVRDRQGDTKEIGILSILDSVPKKSTPTTLRSAMRTIVRDPEAFDVKLNARRVGRVRSPARAVASTDMTVADFKQLNSKDRFEVMKAQVRKLIRDLSSDRAILRLPDQTDSDEDRQLALRTQHLVAEWMKEQFGASPGANRAAYLDAIAFVLNEDDDNLLGSAIIDYTIKSRHSQIKRS